MLVAIHEIEAPLWFVVAAVFAVGFQVASVRIPAPTPPVDLTKFVEALEWLNKSKAQSLREAAKRLAIDATKSQYQETIILRRCRLIDDFFMARKSQLHLAVSWGIAAKGGGGTVEGKTIVCTATASDGELCGQPAKVVETR